MKKSLIIAASTAMLMFCGVGLFACKDTPAQPEMKMQTASEASFEIEYDEASSNKSNKKYQYNLTATYGDTIDLTKLQILWNDGKNETILAQKTDEIEGYVLESDLPASQAAGNYTVSYSYLGWVNELKITINKREISLPTLEKTLYDYDGHVVAPEFVYDQDYVTASGDLAVLEVGQYGAIFTLNDKTNTKWARDENKTADITLNYEIQEGIIDLTSYNAPVTVEYTGNGIPFTPIMGIEQLNVTFAFAGSGNATDPKTVGKYKLTAKLKNSFKGKYKLIVDGNEVSEIKIDYNIVKRQFEKPNAEYSVECQSGEKFDFIKYLFSEEQASLFQALSGSAQIVTVTQSRDYTLKFRFSDNAFFNNQWENSTDNDTITVTFHMTAL